MKVSRTTRVSSSSRRPTKPGRSASGQVPEEMTPVELGSVSADDWIDPDYMRAADVMRGLLGHFSVDRVVYTVIEGAPPSKSRPRFGKGGRVYTPLRDVVLEEADRMHFEGLVEDDGPFTGNAALVCLFFRPNMQRIDADNMLKHVCDAANGVLWVDDSQVTGIAAVVELDAARPRTVVLAVPHTSSMERGSNRERSCAECGGQYVPTYRNAAYCGKACGLAARSPLREAVKCKQCGELFKRTTTTQVLCSSACRAASITGRNKARATDRPYSRCSECDAQLAHRRGGRCRDCWKASP